MEQPDFFSTLLLQFEKSSPLFLLIFVGFALSRWFGFGKEASSVLSRFAFAIALPALLFRVIANYDMQKSPADPKLLIAFFGACLILFFASRLFSRKVLNLMPVGSAIFGTGTVFCNNGLLGLPLAIAMLGEAVVPSISVIISVNALFLWTLVSVAVELAQQKGTLTFRSFGRTMVQVIKNPLIVGIFAGVLWSVTGLKIPYIIDEPVRLIGNSATALSLIVIGMGLCEYGLGPGFKKGAVLSAIKLCIHPLLVFTIAWLIDLGPIETLAVVFLGCLPLGVNVYLMCRQFKAIEEIIASAMIISTVMSALTVPFAVTILRHYFL